MVDELAGGLQLMEGQVAVLQERQQGAQQVAGSDGGSGNGDDGNGDGDGAAAGPDGHDGAFLAVCVGFLSAARPRVGALGELRAGLMARLRELAGFFMVREGRGARGCAEEMPAEGVTQEAPGLREQVHGY